MNLWNIIFYLFKLIKEFKESSFLISYAIVLWCLVLNLQTLLCTPVCEAQISGVTLCPGLRKKIPLFLHFKVIANCYQVPWVRITQRKTSQRDWSAYSREQRPVLQGRVCLVPLTLQWPCPQGWVGSQASCRHHSPLCIELAWTAMWSLRLP